MELSEYYKKIIDESVQPCWHLLAERTNIPPLPVWYKLEYLNHNKTQDIYKVKVPACIVWEGKLISIYLKSEEYKKAIEESNKILFDLRKTKAQVKLIYKFCNVVRKEAEKLTNLNKKSNQELFKIYQKLINAYAISFIYGYITWCAQVLQKECLDILGNESKSLQVLNLNEKEAFGILVLSEKDTPYSKKEKTLDKLIKFKDELSKISNPDEEVLKKELPQVHKGIKKFIKNFGWVGYDYVGPVMSYGEVVDSLLSREVRERKIQKQDIISVCNFSKKEKDLFSAFALLAYAKDLRNATDDFVHFNLENFFGEVGNRFGLTRQEVRYLWPEEIKQILIYGNKFDKKYLKEKVNFCSIDTFGGTSNHFYSDSARQRIKILGITSKNFEENLKEIKGTVASIGKVRGLVRVVESMEEIGKVHIGDILVTRMTSPRFMNGIIKCSAIITDEGGLTSHAAIIAREMRKPCIVGTKVATKVLKDGDMVEADADKGIVRIVKN